ncbi:MAG: arsenic resistance protein [archaeon]
MKNKESLGIFEKYLFVWVAVCMVIGLLMSVFIPTIGKSIDAWKIGGVSIPIGVCLFFMMYPALLNIQLTELKKLAKNPKPILLTLLSNWIVAPLICAFLAYTFLKGESQLIIALILLGSSPCTAMVLVWGSLAKGNQEQNVINTTLNTITIMFLYVPVVSLLTGMQNIQLDRIALMISVGVFIGIPLVIGYISKQMIIKYKGELWFNDIYRNIIGKISIIALLTTLVVIFSLNGQVLLNNPKSMLLVSIPLLLGHIIIVGYNIFVTRIAKLKYKEASITVLIGSSSHFEIAIASAVGLFGVGSMAALGTTMGLFLEVPLMLGVVYVLRYLKSKNFWPNNSADA